MIRVEVRDYCHDCFDFEANVQGAEEYQINGKPSGQTDTIIRCRQRNRCENIRKYIEKEQMKNVKD